MYSNILQSINQSDNLAARFLLCKGNIIIIYQKTVKKKKYLDCKLSYIFLPIKPKALPYFSVKQSSKNNPNMCMLSARCIYPFLQNILCAGQVAGVGHWHHVLTSISCEQTTLTGSSKCLRVKFHFSECICDLQNQ